MKCISDGIVSTQFPIRKNKERPKESSGQAPVSY